jgi:hypothetical protein
MSSAIVLTENGMKEQYGQFFTCGSMHTLDKAHIPQRLWQLIPYASFWGVADDWARESLVKKAPKAIQENLKAVVAAHDDFLDEWLAGDEAKSPQPSVEYVAFSAMRMAADFM